PRQPGQGAPPRGALAPWFIGPEQMDGVTLMPAQANELLAENQKIVDPGAPALDDEKLCKPPWKEKLYLFLRQLCDNRAARETARDWLTFRSVLDAFDRHQLVLLSSAYGLPVIGKRDETFDENGKPTSHGPLIQNSGQFDPGENF